MILEIAVGGSDLFSSFVAGGELSTERANRGPDICRGRAQRS
jgi:hypothetical protein